MLCLPRPSMQTHSCVFPPFVLSRELVSSFQRLLLKCINNAAGFTFVLWHLLQEGQGVCLSEFSGSSRLITGAPRRALRDQGHTTCALSSTQPWSRSTFPVLSLHSNEVQLPPHFAGFCGHLISPILFLTSPIIQPQHSLQILQLQHRAALDRMSCILLPFCSTQATRPGYR